MWSRRVEQFLVLQAEVLQDSFHVIGETIMAYMYAPDPRNSREADGMAGVSKADSSLLQTPTL